MLDDANHIHRLDHSNALGVAAGQPAQLRQRYDFELPSALKPTNIVVAGMGGSALAAEFVASWTSDRLKLPFEIVREYHLPASVTKDTLLVISSYSGNTEETLACLAEGRERGAVIVIMTAGGELAEQAASQKLPLIQIPAGLQPRMAVLYGVKALATLLDKAGILTGLPAELEAAADWVEPLTSDWMAEVATGENLAKQIADQLHGFTAIIYGGPTLAMPARKWKINCNENAKSMAFYYFWPEFSHNEFLGWTNPTDKNFRVVELQSSLDHPALAKRFSVTNRLLSGKMPKAIEVKAQGQTRLQQMLWTLLLGDFMSLYLAVLNNVDPTPVDLIERLKGELAK